jgi:radical SAM superfamily enzyme YgiQ (UPF0313 family)
MHEEWEHIETGRGLGTGKDTHSKKLLLVSANSFAVPYPVYPIGLSYLYSYLAPRLDGFEIRIFDFNLRNSEDLVHVLKEFNPDYTGISLRNVDDVNFYNQVSFIREYKDIVNLVKQHSGSRLIIGGSGFSIYPKHLFDLFEPEFGIHGEGEESLYRLLLCLEGKTDFTGIEGLVYRSGNKIVINSRKNFIQQPDLSFDEALVPFYWSKSGMMNIQTKRGCPYNCIYCTYPLIEGSKARTLDPDRIIHTLHDLKHNRNIDYVFFTDSVFNINNEFNVELAEKMIKAGLDVKWGAYFSPHNLDIGLLKLFKRAGLTHIEFGTESLSDSVLRSYGKHFSVDEVVEISNLCNEVEVYYAHFLILGGYGETEATINEGFENSTRFSNTVFFPYIGMRIYPGTKLAKLAEKDGVISPEDDLLEPVYYIAPDIRYDTLKERAEKTGRRWVFPDEDVAKVMRVMRSKNRKGSLWHHLKK